MRLYIGDDFEFFKLLFIKHVEILKSIHFFVIINFLAHLLILLNFVVFKQLVVSTLHSNNFYGLLLHSFCTDSILFWCNRSKDNDNAKTTSSKKRCVLFNERYLY